MLSPKIIQWLEALDRGASLQDVWREMIVHFKYEAIRVFEIHEGAGEVTYSAGKPIVNQEALPAPNLFDRGVLGAAIRDGGVLEARDYARHEHALENRKQEIKSLVALPLIHAGKKLGVLVMMNTEEFRKKLTALEMQELRVMQSVFSAYLARKRIERNVNQQRGLLAFTAKIHSVKRIEQLVPMLFKSMGEHLDYSVIYLALLEGAAFRFYFAIGEGGKAPEQVGESISALHEAPLTKRIIETGEPILIGEVEDPAVRKFYPMGEVNVDSGDEVDIHSYMGAMFEYGDMRGVISVQSVKPWRYGLAELEYLEMLSQAMAYGIESVRWKVLDQATKRLSRLDWDHEDPDAISLHVLTTLADLWSFDAGAVYAFVGGAYRRSAATDSLYFPDKIDRVPATSEEARLYSAAEALPGVLRGLWPQGVKSAIYIPLPEGFAWLTSKRGFTDWDLRIARSLARELEPHFRRLGRQLRLRSEAALDPLTGVYNRRKLDERLQRLISLAGRYGDTFTVVVVDMLNFGEVNNRHGHLVGDRVLARAASVLKENMREGDDVFRMGGDEFVILLRRSKKQDALKVAWRCAEALQHDEMLKRYGVAANFGLAEYREGSTPEALLAEADREMYAAKAQRVSVLGADSLTKRKPSDSGG